MRFQKRRLPFLYLNEYKAKHARKTVWSSLISKKFAVLMAVMLTMTVLLSTTFAWFASNDGVTNRLNAGTLGVKITEQFTPINDWKPGQEVKKEVTFLNTGNTNSVVRVSLNEILMLFSVDLETANLSVKTEEDSDIVASASDTAGWQKGNLFPAYTYNPETGQKEPRTNGSGKFLFHIIDSVYQRDYINNHEGGRELEIGRYITINWNDSVSSDTTAKGSKWLYYDSTNDGIDNGYFYYLDILEPGKQTVPLIDSLTVSPDLPNTWKNAPYKLDVYVESTDARVGAPEEMWGLPTNSEVYKALADKLMAAS